MKSAAYRSSNPNLGNLGTQPQHVRSAVMALTLVALTGCLPSRQAQAPSIASGHPAAENALRNPTPQDFPKRIISEVALGNPVTSDAKIPPLATVPVKGLMQTTRPDDRTQKVMPNLGRDPFAASLATELQHPALTQFGTPKSRQTVPIWSKPAAKSAATSALRSQKPTVPQTPRLRSPGRPTASSNLPTVFVPNTLPPLAAPVPIEPLPVISPTALADQVEITGVVQVGDRVMAIAKAPEETSAHYVNTGDRLSSGRVIVREIRTGRSPSVVLEQNGQKVVKSIGANRAPNLTTTIRSFGLRSYP